MKARLKKAVRSAHEVLARRGWRYVEYMVEGVAFPAALAVMAEHAPRLPIPSFAAIVASRGERMRHQQWWADSSARVEPEPPAVTRIELRSYRDAGSFLNARKLFAHLAGKAPVPDLRAVDERDLRLSLGAFGDWHPWPRGDAGAEYALSRSLDAVHRHGIVDLSFQEADIAWEPATQRVLLMGFERARVVDDLSSPVFWHRRDLDRQRANDTLGSHLLTISLARALCKDARRRVGFWYAPVDFGHGLTIGSFWGTNAGTGRWEYFNGPRVAPLVRGQRVVDLGSNNGLGPLMMLRAGAQHVVGFELDSNYYATSKALQRLFEWADMRPYSLEIRNANMLDFCTSSLECDVVTAYCSLYYLDEQAIARVIRSASERAPTMILQGNESKRSDRVDQPRRDRATAGYLKAALLANGYRSVDVLSAPRFSRPLLIGHR